MSLDEAIALRLRVAPEAQARRHGLGWTHERMRRRAVPAAAAQGMRSNLPMVVRLSSARWA